MPTGQKHVVKCRCVLPQFKSRSDPPLHAFPVFSVVDDDGAVRPKLAQCNNCGTVHKVVDICKSEILVGQDESRAVITIDDIRSSLSEQLAGVLDAHDADVATWEAAQFIIENKRWGDFVVLASDLAGDERRGKYVRILGDRIHKVESFSREEWTKT